MAFVRMYQAGRSMACLINLAFVSRVEPRGSGATVYMGESASVNVTAGIEEIQAAMGEMTTVGKPAPPPKKPSEFEGAPTEEEMNE